MTETKRDPYSVLFLCTGNSARSIMAEAILAREGGDHFRAYSAGSQPKGQVHPQALSLLRQLGHDTARLSSKSWEMFAGDTAPPLDFVFTVCDSAAQEPCPIWPGQPVTAHWGLPDPAAVTGTDAEVAAAFHAAYRALAHRISIFISLPLQSLDLLTLQNRLEALGADEPAV